MKSNLILLHAAKFSPRLLVVVFYVGFTCSNVNAEVSFTEEQFSIIKSFGPWPSAIPDDPGNELSGLSWAEKLGEALFFDPSLSVNNSSSCGSCHQPDAGFSDGLDVAVGTQRGVRNTQGLLNVGLQKWFGWDGGADSLWAASIRPMLAPHEMGNTIEQLAKTLRNNKSFSDAVKLHLQASNSSKNTENLSDEQWVVFAAKSIAAYIRTINSKETAFDKFRAALLNGDVDSSQGYSESAQRGLQLFIGEANCHVCHFGPNFSNGEFHDTGRPFFTAVGQIDPGRYKGIQRVTKDQFNLNGEFAESVSDEHRLKTTRVKLGQTNWGQWRTPSLRNLKQTAPYTHDGSLETLKAVVDAYADINPERLHAAGESILKPLQMSEQQRMELVEFLLTLSSE